MNREAARSEFDGRKWMVLAASLGLTTGLASTMVFSLGAFVPALQAEFGWERGQISLALTIMTFGMFLSGPWIGRLCDRFGAATVGALSLLAYALGIAVLGFTVQRIEMFWLAYFLIALVGTGSTPVVLTRPVSTGFDRRRGLALGIVMTGAGIAGFWVPITVARVSEAAGWRAAYLTLAATAVLAAPLVWWAFRRVERDGARGVAAAAATTALTQTGLSVRAARGTRSFWLLLAMALSMGLGIAGMLVHLVPLFRDLGATPLRAAQTASLIGVSGVLGRLGVGFALDRFSAARVSIAVFAMAMSGILLLWATGLQFAPLAVILIGTASGAEADLLAYLCARLFGRREYATIYGWQYGVFALGFGFSPFLVGLLRDQHGDYRLAMLGSVALLGLSAVTALGLGRAQAGMQVATQAGGSSGRGSK